MILIITIGSKNVGYGHLSRSILIQNKIRKKSEIFIFNENQKIIDLKKKKVISFKEASFKLFERKIIICDFANSKVIKNRKLKFFLNEIAKTNAKIIFFDDLKKQKFYKNFFKKERITLIRPYVDKYEKNVYYGLKYFVANPNLNKKIRKKINKKITNILITFGGSDANDYTSKILNYLLYFNYLDDYLITVVVGPYYDRHKIFKLKKNLLLNKIKWVHKINDISKLIQKSDLVITTCGTTKYEVAAVRCPQIVIPISKISEKKNNLFQKENLSVTLKYNFNRMQFNKIFKKILSFELRKKLYKNCRHKIDTKGIKRLERFI
jgi:spore coat polysaccharide biosynthesis predicted glycosyltransferase SpsG